MNKNSLTIINNEKIFKHNNDFYCDNLDLKIIPEGLSDYYEIHYIVRNSNKKGNQKINLKNIKVAKNIFKFIYFIFKTFNIRKMNYLIISITPYTFFSFLFLALFRKKVFVYIFSSGHEEYKRILGNWSVIIYHIMYKIVTSNSKVIVNHERLFNKEKSFLITSSRLNEKWLSNYKDVLLEKIKFLYVGRLNPEKGIYEFLEMFKKIKLEAEFSIVDDTQDQKHLNKNIKFLGYISDEQALINVYDNHNITILPSFTEAFPYVVDESLSRKRPVIIFEEISHVAKNKSGIFVSKRNIESFLETTKYVMENYNKIQKDIEKNILPTKKQMLEQITKILN